MEFNKDSRTITISQNTGITVSVALMVMFAGAVFTVATWSTDVRRSTIDNTQSITDIKADVAKLQIESVDSRVKFSEIQTQLKSIDLSLVEIKERL